MNQNSHNSYSQLDSATSQEQKDLLPPVAVPLEALSLETAESLVDSFILREGTDYGLVEISLEAKREKIFKQLKKSDLVISFDPNTESVSILSVKDWKLLTNQK